MIVNDSIVSGLSRFRDDKGESGNIMSIGGTGIERVTDEVKREAKAGKVKLMANDIGRD